MSAAGPLIPTELLRVAGRGAAQHWQARGLQPDPLAGLLRYLYVDICPPALQNPELASLPAVQSMRPVAVAPAGPTPDELSALPDRPLIYLTLGTVYNRDLSVFATVLEGLRDEPVSVVVTIGRNNDPEALGPQPPHIAVHRYIPQAALLPHCSAAVIHGGAGTMLGALAAGLPLLCLPQGADQHGNADRVVAAGAGLEASLPVGSSRRKRSERPSRPCWTNPATGRPPGASPARSPPCRGPRRGARRDRAGLLHLNPAGLPRTVVLP